eukprot:CAMPEP_0174902502 /NCGR_PEP_ID=MMETSP0167-20121228/37995_1 /TAXON_ID=38298 /ORGANISM="Rhodella maculata, Strain CCMP736" /LENGTH=147 /DNA_ID=CAMNT_0016144527 /DNA_START=119 /DNA_END=558 /DNA_ORIENTATION=-
MSPILRDVGRMMREFVRVVRMPTASGWLSRAPSKPMREGMAPLDEISIVDPTQIAIMKRFGSDYVATPHDIYITPGVAPSSLRDLQPILLSEVEKEAYKVHFDRALFLITESHPSRGIGTNIWVRDDSGYIRKLGMYKFVRPEEDPT